MKITVEDLRKLEADWTEHQHQREVIRWAKDHQFRFPELKWLYANVNGERRTVWQRAQKVAEGMKSGVPDLHLPVSRLNRHGLWIEMKAKKNTTSESQREWAAALNSFGHVVVTCRSWRSAVECLEDYLTNVPVERWSRRR